MESRHKLNIIIQTQSTMFEPIIICEKMNLTSKAGTVLKSFLLDKFHMFKTLSLLELQNV